MNRWSAPGTVEGFLQSPPNEALLGYAAHVLARIGTGTAVDLGCGAARNAAPLAAAGWRVLGTDSSWPMLEAAPVRIRREGAAARVDLVQAAMDALPLRDGIADLVVAHGIWNLARGSDEFRRAVREAARIARPGAGLFLFTFSRNTLPKDALPVAGETFVFTQFAGEPQCFLSGEQVQEELGAAGFRPDGAIPLRELNRPAGLLRTAAGPVIYEGTFQFVR